MSKKINNRKCTFIFIFNLVLFIFISYPIVCGEDGGGGGGGDGDGDGSTEGKDGKGGKTKSSFSSKIGGFFSGLANALGFAASTALGIATGGVSLGVAGAAANIGSIGTTGNTISGNAISAAKSAMGDSKSSDANSG